jgi:hypothetical protein
MIPSFVTDYPNPAYPLSDVIAKAQVRYIRFREEALNGAAELEFSPQDITDCITGLSPGDFFKSMDAKNPVWAGCRQDVYKTRHLEKEIYVKFQYWPNKTERLFIISFKGNTDDHND